jgi:aminopeptidase N
MECCWEQQEHGDEHFQYYVLQEMERYIEEDRSEYRRPLVCNRYEEPIELFDRHLYEKGACVQHMLRGMLGERLFWKALRHYVERHAGECVVTSDWAAAIEDATGRNVDEFFDQWVYGGGFPEFKLGFSYNSQHRLAALSVAQTQKPNDLTSVFKVPVTVAFSKLGENGSLAQREERVLQVEEAEHRFHVPLDFEPDLVTFDVGGWVLKTLDVSALPEGMLVDQLRHDTDVQGRVHAARELGKRPSRRAVAALGETLASEAPWFIQAEAAKALANSPHPQSLKFLLESVGTPHPKTRRAVVKALGEFPGEAKAADALLDLLARGDESYFVEAEACQSLGKTRDRRAKDALYAALEQKDSFNEAIRIGALDGLVALEDVSALERIRDCCKRGVPVRLRFNAFSRLGSLAKFADEADRLKVRRAIEEALEEPDFFISLGTVAGLKELGDPEAAGALRRKERLAVDGRVKARARKAAEFLLGKDAVPRQVRQLRDELQEVKKQNKQFLERIEKLEANAPDAT